MAKLLSFTLANNTTLVSLSLPFNSIGKDGARWMGKALADNTALTRLDLSGNRVGHEGALALFTSLGQNRTLLHLDLSSNGLGYRGARAISYMEKLEPLMSLEDPEELERERKRRETSFNPDELDEETIVLRTAATTLVDVMLQTVNLAGNEIGDEGAREVARAIARNSRITELSLADNKIGYKGGRAIAAMLEAEACALVKLDVSNNELNYKGTTAICDALTQRGELPLRQLDLGKNEIGPNAAVHVARLIQANRPMSKLYLWGNLIDDAGALAIRQARRQNKHLKMLAINKQGCENVKMPPPVVDKRASFLMKKKKKKPPGTAS